MAWIDRARSDRRHAPRRIRGWHLTRRHRDRVALDDFGEGDLHFMALRDAPFDVVKLPVQFVKRAGAMYDDTVIAAGVGFARSIGAKTVAEGVETTAIRDRVRELGCEIGQGYLWSRQVPGDELPDVISAIRIDGAASPKP
ncbi:MAG TPA: EAL domain-containing protein [Candidatus Limnocylindria bacterium]|nr:EAL domain-containing protein [Candidatus Limnocylindria bacterium]